MAEHLPGGPANLHSDGALFPANELLLRNFAIGIFENLAQHSAPHLLGWVHPVQVQDGRSKIVDAGVKTHQPKALLDAGAHGEE